jgi:uncharacterized membrane protein YkoI
MAKARSLPVLIFALACGTQTSSGPTPTAAPEPAPDETTTPTPTAAVDTADTAPPQKTATVIDREIVETAMAAGKVDKMKIRVDAEGTIVKQSLYHDDSARIPEAVRTLAETKFPGAKVIQYETELYSDIGRVYEVEVKTKDGKQCEVAADSDGKEQYTECRIANKELPAEVASAVKSAAPGGKIIEAERKTRPDGEEYTVEVKTSSGELYLRFKPDGSPLAKLRRIPAIVEVPLP